MIREKASVLFGRMKKSLRENIRFATLDMVFILVFIQVFQGVFGMENSIVGVIFTILMASSMARDLTARPVKHFFLQASVLVLMTCAASLVAFLPPLAALPVNLGMLFLILYAFTYEYASQLYFPYILAYLFLVFISPVPLEQLPKRLAGVLAGAVCVMLYQFVMGGHRVRDVVRDALSGILDEASGCIGCLLAGKGTPEAPEKVRKDLRDLCRIVYERRKRVLCISDASFAAVDAGRGLEHLVLLLYAMEGGVGPERRRLLEGAAAWLADCRAFLHRETKEVPPLEPLAWAARAGGEAEELFRALEYLRVRLVKMTQPEKRRNYRPTAQSLWDQLKAALDVSPVRLCYAVRVSVLLALAALAVQELALPHGKWLLFTLASVSLPYADDVPQKAWKRFAATVIGSAVSLAAFALIPSSGGRTALMLLSGYASFYFAGYTGSFACSTVGALGGAVFLSSFGWGQVGGMVAIRLCYIVAGIAVGLLVNRALFPFWRRKATGQLLEKYRAASGRLAEICRAPDADTQLYYSLVIQAHLMEEKLLANCASAGWDGMEEILRDCRRQVRDAHRSRAQVPA